MFYYEINKTSSEVEIIESSVLMVQEFKELVDYFSGNKDFPKFGFYYFRVLILLCSPRSPFNRNTMSDDDKIDKVITSLNRQILKDFGGVKLLKAPQLDKKIIAQPIFQIALAKFMELETDPVFEQYKALEFRLQQYSMQIKQHALTLENAGDYKNMIATGKALQDAFEECRRVIFDKLKSSEQLKRGGGPTLHNLLTK